MHTYIVLLRGINVSGKNLVKMDALKQALLTHGFTKVSTYIQSGNIVVQTPLDKTAAQKQFEAVLLNQFQVNVPVFILLLSDLENAVANNPFPATAEPNKVFFTFLDTVPNTTLVEKLQTIDFGNEVFHVQNKILYFYVPNGMGKSKMNNNFFEKKLNVTATGRNLNTILKLIALTTAID